MATRFWKKTKQTAGSMGGSVKGSMTAEASGTDYTVRGASLWEISKRKAENPSVWKKMRHSRFFDKYRRGVMQSAREVGKKGIGLAVSFIPIPVVKDVVKGALEKAGAAIRSHYTGSTLAEYEAMDTTGMTPEELKIHTQKKVKWGWKDLDIADMDRFRWKIKHGIEVLNDALKKAQDAESSSASICNDWSRPMAKYHYLKRRLIKLRTKATEIQELANATLAWVDQVETSIDAAGTQGALMAKSTAIAAIGPTDDSHAQCSKTVCVHGTDIRWSEKHRTAVARMSTMTSFTVNDLGDLAPNPLDAGTYQGDTYKKAD